MKRKQSVVLSINHSQRILCFVTEGKSILSDYIFQTYPFTFLSTVSSRGYKFLLKEIVSALNVKGIPTVYEQPCHFFENSASNNRESDEYVAEHNDFQGNIYSHLSMYVITSHK